MRKATKKPVTIEFVILENTEQSIEEVQRFIQEGFLNNDSCNRSRDAWDDYVKIVRNQGGIRLKTLESDGETQLASFGDYIIKGVKGEFYPCKPEIFLMTYDILDTI